MPTPILQVIHPGLGASIQDRGRAGWRRFGVPPGGAMDGHAAGWANRLLENPPEVPVLEMLLQGVVLEATASVWIAVTGANAACSIPAWRPVRVESGERIEFPQNRAGVWIYLAVENGFAAPRFLGSASVYPRGKLGSAAHPGDLLSQLDGPGFILPRAVAGRTVAWSERRDYNSPPPLRVWRGPQWDLFSESERESFFAQTWTVSSRSDRVGYRLEGAPLQCASEIISEPVLVGSIQIPPDGQPIITMRDGPTVGGYPKLGLVAPADLSWLAQCRPGTTIQFDALDETGSEL